MKSPQFIDEHAVYDTQTMRAMVQLMTNAKSVKCDCIHCRFDEMQHPNEPRLVRFKPEIKTPKRVIREMTEHLYSDTFRLSEN